MRLKSKIMKRYRDLFDKICSYDNLLLAHHNARKGKTHYREVQKVDKDVEVYLSKLQTNLKNKSYKTSNYIIEERFEGRKLREIHKLPYYPDRIVHHAIMNIVGDIWVKSLIRDTYQSIKGRGVHLAARRIQKALSNNKEETKFCLKIDIKKYYPSVDNEILKSIIRIKIKDNDLLELLYEIIDSTKGLPIGNYLSQIFGNLYLSYFDHWVKEKKNIKFYYRYCDDCIFLSNYKTHLHKLKQEVDDYLCTNLKLTIKNNWQIFPISSRGIDFLGYKFYHSHTLLRKSIKESYRKKMSNISEKWENLDTTKVVNPIMSYSGWMKYADCKSLERFYITPHIKKIVKIKNNK